MATKTEISCDMCDAYFELIEDLEYPYVIQYCPFCGEELDASGDSLYVSYISTEEDDSFEWDDS